MTSTTNRSHETARINLKKIKAVIFDLDGTLYKMNWSLKPLITLLLLPNIFYLPKYMGIRKFLIGKDFKNGDLLLNKMSKLLSDKLPGSSPSIMKKWILYRFYPSFIRTLALTHRSRKGIIKTLKHLKNQNIKIAVLSDFAMIKERLTSIGIPPSLFDIIKSSESCGALKPSERPFIEISRLFNIDPSHILVIGDRDDTDGIAARSCGMIFLQITDLRKKENNQYSWEDLQNLLFNI